MTDLSVILVNHNTEPLLHRAIQGVRDNLLSHTAEVLVADNSDIPLAACAADLFFHTENRGFAAACNAAAAHAGGRFLLLLNADVRLSDGVLDAVLAYADAHGADVLGIRTFLPDGRFDRGCLRGFPTPFASLCYFCKLDRLFPRSRRIGAYHQTFRDRAVTQRVPCVSGAFLLIRRSLYERLSGMDEAFFLHGEDIDLCYRANAVGAAVVYYAEKHIVHEKGGSTSDRNRGQVSRALADSMRLFYDKHYKRRYPLFVTWAVHGAIALRRGMGGRA